MGNKLHTYSFKKNVLGTISCTGTLVQQDKENIIDYDANVNKSRIKTGTGTTWCYIFSQFQR